MKSLLYAICIFSCQSALAMPLAVTRSVTQSEADGKQRSTVVYASGDEKVLIVQKSTDAASGKTESVFEFYYYKGLCILISSWSTAGGSHKSITAQHSTAKNILISAGDSNSDGFVDEVLITSDNFPADGFKRNDRGEMMPITPLIVDSKP